MKNHYTPLFVATLMTGLLSVPALSHGTSRHASMAGQNMSGQGHMMAQKQMRRPQGQRRASRMEIRRDHRLKQKHQAGTHQMLESHNTILDDPDIKSAFADE